MSPYHPSKILPWTYTKRKSLENINSKLKACRTHQELLKITNVTLKWVL